MKGKDIQVGEVYAIGAPSARYMEAKPGRILAVGKIGDRYEKKADSVEFIPLQDDLTEITDPKASQPIASHSYSMTIRNDDMPAVRGSFHITFHAQEGDREAYRAPHGHVLKLWADYVICLAARRLRDAREIDRTERHRKHAKDTATAMGLLAGVVVRSSDTGFCIELDLKGAQAIIEKLGGTMPKLDPMPERFAELKGGK